MKNIVELVESYGVELKKNGQLYVGFCPFHDDRRTPNLYVYESTQSFCCYRCNLAGGAIKFISLIEGRDEEEVKKMYIAENIKDKLLKLGQNKQNELRCKNEVLLFTANFCREFLHKNIDKADRILPILKKLDEALQMLENVDQNKKTEILEKFKKYVYTI